MKAIVYREYGSPDVLRCEDVDKPAPGDREVLVKVRAASVNPLDWHFMRGAPYAMRLMSGLRTPKSGRLGVDVAGIVEAAGGNVTRFKPGDAVFGAGHGTLAEYVSVGEQGLSMKPAGMTFEQAAAIPVAGLTALQAVRDKAKLQRGQTLLINGAAGGVGTFAVQIAKALGAEVTGVCSTTNVDLVRTLGATRVIDYTKEDFTASAERFDVMLDNVGNRTLSECRRVLKPKGQYVMIGGQSGAWIAPLDRFVGIAIASFFVSQHIGTLMMSSPTDKDLSALSDLVAAGKVMPVIDRRYPLSETADAMRHLETGHARGKVVVGIPE
jgi:NADPH:quinone reductase-like Zn-dependent oxidoreductase